MSPEEVENYPTISARGWEHLYREVEKRERKKFFDLLVTTMIILTGACWGFFISACMVVLVLPYDDSVKVFVVVAFVVMALIGPGIDPITNMAIEKMVGGE